MSVQTVGVFAAARDEVNIASPYFIPGERGMAVIRRAMQANGRFTLVTNSLGSTDEPMVYRGYARFVTSAYKLRLASDGEHIEWVETDATASRPCT